MPIKTVGSNWNIIPLSLKDRGKEVRVEIIPVYESFRSRPVTFLTGSLPDIFMERFYLDLPQLALGGMTLLTGIVTMCIAGYSQITKKRGKGILSLGVFSVMLGIWKLTDTRFTPFLFPDYPVQVSMITMLMLLFGPLPILQWIRACTAKENRRYLDVLCVMDLGLIGIQLILQFLGIRDLRQMLPLSHAALLGSLLFAAWQILKDRRNAENGADGFRGEHAMILLAAGVLLDLLFFYQKGNSSGLLFTLLAYLLYVIDAGISTIFHYSHQEIQIAELDRKVALQERKLTEEKITLMFGQIRTHFIFNVLATISGYCKTNPRKADEVLVRFSRYLRKNMHLIEEEGLIPFSTELEQLEDFVALEQVRFPDRIVFKKHLQVTEFQIPPFTLQPLVENAVRHGILPKGETGTIFLETKQEDGWIVITVKDDGIGFSAAKEEEKNSVGLRNVAYRLEHMAEGNLKIQSSKEGTCVEIRLPEGTC